MSYVYQIFQNWVQYPRKGIEFSINAWLDLLVFLTWMCKASPSSVSPKKKIVTSSSIEFFLFFLIFFSLKKVAEQGKVDPISRLESDGKTHFGSRINGLWVVLSRNSYQWLRSPFTLKLHCKLPTIWESCFYQCQWIYEMWASNGETVLIRRKSMSHFSGNWSEWIHSMNVWCLECLSLIRPK